MYDSERERIAASESTNPRGMPHLVLLGGSGRENVTPHGVLRPLQTATCYSVGNSIAMAPRGVRIPGDEGGMDFLNPASTAAGSGPQSAPEVIDLLHTVMIFDQESLISAILSFFNAETLHFENAVMISAMISARIS